MIRIGKNLCIFFFLFLTLSLIISCQTDPSLNVIVSIDNKVKTTTEEIKLSITNNSQKDIAVSNPIRLQIKNNDEWEDIQILKDSGYDIALLVRKNKTSSITIPVQDYYGRLTEGDYRFIINFAQNGGYYTAIGYFTINDN